MVETDNHNISVGKFSPDHNGCVSNWGIQKHGCSSRVAVWEGGSFPSPVTNWNCDMNWQWHCHFWTEGHALHTNTCTLTRSNTFNTVTLAKGLPRAMNHLPGIGRLTASQINTTVSSPMLGSVNQWKCIPYNSKSHFIAIVNTPPAKRRARDLVLHAHSTNKHTIHINSNSEMDSIKHLTRMHNS